jgi:outer membrane protein, heavy metal efflux system
MRISTILLTLALLTSIATTALAQTDRPVQEGLSLSQALSLAAANSPLTRQSNEAVKGAAARLRSAHAPQNPTLSLAHWAGRDTGGLDEDIVLTQIVELGGKRTYRARAAGAELSAARYEQIGTALDLRLSVKTAYYGALRAQEEYDLAQTTLDGARKFAEAARTQFEAGDAPRSNVIRAEIELTRSEQGLAQAQTERDNSLAELVSLIGKPAGTPVVLSDTLTFVPASYSTTALEALALETRPDLLAVRATRSSLAAATQTARAESRPDLFIEGRRASIEPSVEGASIRAGITLSPFDLGKKRADVAAARSAVAEQDARIAEAERTARLDVETASRNLEAARKAVESFESGRLARGKELLDMAQTGYEKGASTYLEVLDAQNVYRNEQADYARALASYNIALATLERAAGGKLP